MHNQPSLSLGYSNLLEIICSADAACRFLCAVADRSDGEVYWCEGDGEKAETEFGGDSESLAVCVWVGDTHSGDAAATGNGGGLVGDRDTYFALLG